MSGGQDEKGEDDSYEGYGCEVNRDPPFSGRVLEWAIQGEVKPEANLVIQFLAPDWKISYCCIIDMFAGLSRCQHKMRKIT